MILRAELAQRVFGTLLLLHPGKAAAALMGIGGRIVEGGIQVSGADPLHHVAFENGRPSLGIIGDRLGRAYDEAGFAPYDILDNVAVIGVEGTLVHKGAFVGMSSGRTSYQGLQAQASRALRDPKIKGVVFEVDSFGGEAAGAFETADVFALLSDAKPTLAILTENALSGGYLLAAAARQIVMPPSGQAGSIGVITLHIDYSRQLEQEGIKVTILAAGKHKADGNPFQALPDTLATRIKSDIEASRRRLAAQVGRYRGRRFTADQAMASEADTFGAEEAVKLGLADAVGDSQAAFSAFLAEVNR